TPNPLCSGATLSLNSTPSGGSGTYSSYAWSGPNSFSAATQNASVPSITAAGAGTYTVSVPDNNGCTGSVVTSAVTVNALPVISATATPNPLCSGSTLSLNSTPSGGSGTYTSYSWVGPNSYTATVQYATVPGITAAGDGIYTVTVTDNNGCSASHA